MFDWHKLRRWGLREDRLPPESTVLYRSPSLWERYRWQIVGVLGLLALESLLVAGLLVERRHRRRAQGALAERTREMEASNRLLGAYRASVEREPLIPAGAPLDYIPRAGP